LTTGFDYERAIWGREAVAPGDRTIAGFRLDEALHCLPQAGTALEIGCGAGRFLRGITRARPALRMVGTDVSRAALQEAHGLAPGLDLRPVDPAQGAFRLPAEDGEFDAVLALDVLEHLEDPAAMLAEAARVLKPGGVIHLHVPCEGDVTCLWRWIPGQRGPRALKRRLGGHIQHFRRGEVLELIRGAGFQVVRRRYSLHVLGNLADVGVFLLLARRQRAAGTGFATTTGDILDGESGAGLLVRSVDRALWFEARLAGRIPTWGLHVSARKRVSGG
jgi:SAM-dependent methyltransferase